MKKLTKFGKCKRTALRLDT